MSWPHGLITHGKLPSYLVSKAAAERVIAFRIGKAEAPFISQKGLMHVRKV
jgi:hypothetical protein